MGRLRLSFAAASAVVVLAGCGSKKDEVEVAAFKGGFGIDFYQNAAAEFNSNRPGLPVDVWGNSQVWDQLQPRFTNGTPPDLSFTGWGLDFWALVYDHQVDSWDDALDGPAYDGKGKWRDTFLPTVLDLGEYQGKVYLMPYFIDVEGWWYDPDLFAKHGWTPPKTWSELLALCEKIQKAGLAPITYQGKYPPYMIVGFLLPWAISAGGMEAVDDAQNLVPGAWKSPAMLEAARKIDELRARGFFEKGAIGMSHTIAQTEFIEGRAAMIPCGTWLHTEMKDQLPRGFKMRFFNPPVLDGGKGDPTNVCIGIEPWALPSKAKHKKAAVAFFKYMTSLEKAKEFVKTKGSLTAIKGSDQVQMPDELVDAAKAMRTAKTTWSDMYGQWYPKFSKETEGAMTALLSGDATPEQFCERCEQAAQAARDDKELPKHKVIR